MSKHPTLKPLELYYESMLELMPGHVYWKDKNGILQGCNNNLAKTLNLPSCKAIVGKADEDISSKQEAKAIKERDFKVMETGVEQTNEELYTLPNGLKTTYLTQRSPIFNKNNEVIGLIGISFDITERKKMEEDLFLAKEKAEAANFIMTEFIANMGHDLVTPFSDIGGVAEVLYTCFSDKYPELKEYFEILVKQCAACESVHKRIIDATSMTNLDIKQDTFSIYDELINIEAVLRPSIGSKNLELIIDPFEPETEDLIKTDREKVHAILAELVSNAINFTEEGQVRVSAFKRNDWFTIEVSDTGIGIPSNKFDYIFEQFTKLSRSNKYGSNFKGVGAGLYLVKQRAKLLDAHVSLKSKEGKGSTFTLSIPATPLKNA